MSPQSKNTFLNSYLSVIAFLSASFILLIIYFISKESFFGEASFNDLSFFTDSSWNPAEEGVEAEFLLSPMIWGTLLCSFGALLLSLPFALAIAVFNAFFSSNKTEFLIEKIVELLAGIPSVIYGFWGIAFLIPIINKIEKPGASLLAGIIILSLMILPTLALLLSASFQSINRDVILNAQALNLSRETFILKIVLKTRFKAILNASLLAVTRAIGETMAVLMVCGNVIQSSPELLKPIRTLTANIALELGYATGLHRTALFTSASLLLLLVLLCMAINTVFLNQDKTS